MSDGDPCAFPDCDGALDAGYCDTCGRAPRMRRTRRTRRAVTAARSTEATVQLSPRAVPSLRPTPSGIDQLGPQGALPGLADVGPRPSGTGGSPPLGMGLVDLPAVSASGATESLMDPAEVPEDQRFCSNCEQPVGRSRNQRPGRTEGFCPHCRTHFTFTPELAAGALVGGQYEVMGALAHGVRGWTYLACDRATYDRWVVLEAFPVTEAAGGDAEVDVATQHRSLAGLDHPNLARVHGVVAHDDAAYVVTEYVGGKTSRTVVEERRRTNGGDVGPLPVTQAIACVLGVLPAVAYLHAWGLVYGDVTPDDVVLTGESLKLVGVGGVRRVGDEVVTAGSPGYRAPEVAQEGPSPVSDLYAVGRTLAALSLDLDGHGDAYVDRLPSPDGEPLLHEHESLHRFLLKATAVDPTDRFRSAEEMAQQLVGVLREEVAAEGHAHPAPSTIFGPERLVLGADQDAHDGGAATLWRLLPRPKVDPADPGADFLLGLAESEPAEAAATISSALASRTVPASTEMLLRLARAQVAVGSCEQASTTLDSLADARDWRLWWHRGLVALADGEAVDAVGWLDPVYTELPGEVAPKLALGLAHELAGDLTRSRDLYDRVVRIDPSYVSGAFGLARVRVALGDREGAVEALERVRPASGAYADAQLAIVRALTARTDGGVGAPSSEQLTRASTLLQQLDLDPHRRARLEAELLEVGLATVALGGPVDEARVLDRPLDERALRLGLEAVYRDLARQATTAEERVDLVDRANQVRPRTLF